MTDPQQHIWEPIEGESARAQDACRVYLAMDPAVRSIDGAWRNQESLKGHQIRPGKRADVWRRWAARYNWQERAQAYDRHIERQAQEAREKAVRQLATAATEEELAQRAEFRRLKLLAIEDYEKGRKMPRADVHHVEYGQNGEVVKDIKAKGITFAQLHKAGETIALFARLAVHGHVAPAATKDDGDTAQASGAPQSIELYLKEYDDEAA